MTEITVQTGSTLPPVEAHRVFEIFRFRPMSPKGRTRVWGPTWDPFAAITELQRLAERWTAAAHGPQAEGRADFNDDKTAVELWIKGYGAVADSVFGTLRIAWRDPSPRVHSVRHLPLPDERGRYWVVERLEGGDSAEVARAASKAGAKRIAGALDHRECRA